jgi:hypothetical protein
MRPILLTLLLTACSVDMAKTSPDAGAPPACPGSASLLCNHAGQCELPDGGLCEEPQGSGFTHPDGGTTARPAIEISTSGSGAALTAWDFGSQEDGSASPALALTVTNETDVTSDVLAVTSGSGFPLDPASTCPANIELAPGASCSIFVRFDPSVPGALAGELEVDGGSAVGSAALELSGSGLPAPNLATVPPFYDFQVVEFAVGSATTLELVNGGDDLSITSVALAPGIGSGLSIASTTCGGDLPATAQCAITITFAPTGFGQDSAALVVATTAGPVTIPGNWVTGEGGARLTAVLSGTGTVTSDGGGVPDIACGPPGGPCAGLFSNGPDHVLTEDTPGIFNGWGEAGAACGSSSTTCAVTLSTTGPTTVTARFTP